MLYEIIKIEGCNSPAGSRTPVFLHIIQFGDGGCTVTWPSHTCLRFSTNRQMIPIRDCIFYRRSLYSSVCPVRAWSGHCTRAPHPWKQCLPESCGCGRYLVGRSVAFPFGPMSNIQHKQQNVPLRWRWASRRSSHRPGTHPSTQPPSTRPTNTPNNTLHTQTIHYTPNNTSHTAAFNPPYKHTQLIHYTPK